MSKLEFTNRNGLKLAASLELPPGGRWQATALFAHCFTCSRDIRAARDITRALAKAGFAVLRFDFTGLGESAGDFADTSFSSNLDDLEDAAGWLADKLGAPQLLLGHSLGGTAALAVAERLDSVRAVATLGAPASPEHVLKQFGDGLERIEQEGSAEVELAGRSFSVRRDFIEDARSHDLDARLKGLKRALLVMHSPIDDVVPVEQAQKIFTAARHPKSFVSLDDADHLLSRGIDSEYAGSVIAAWAARFLEIPPPKPVEQVQVHALTAHGFVCSVQAGEHHFIADEPADKGGKDLGPDPYDFLATSLGTCTVMTLSMYARRKKLPLTGVACEVRHRRVHADDCDGYEGVEGYIHQLERSISVEGDLSDQERERLLQIAARCPVHRTLEGHIEVSSKLVESPA